jgi:integrase
MRREEISRLTWDNVDLGKSSAHLPKTKNGEARTIPLSPSAIEILQRMKFENIDTESSIQHNILVFGMSKDAITQAMEKARTKAGIENLHFHDLRHEATSRLFENTDLDVMEIRVITGHKNLQMLARYTHLRTARLVERLAGAKKMGKPVDESQEK